MDTENLTDPQPRFDRFLVLDWLVEPALGQISREGETVRIEPKAMEVLVYLARRQGEVVSREELEREVWRGALVGYDAVTGTVIKLRKALGDSARQSKIIRTIPKRGYQLVARASPLDGSRRPPAGGPVSSDREAIPDTSRATRPGPIFVITLLVGLVAIGLALFFLNTRDVPPSADVAPHPVHSEPPSIAVLPFENLSDDQEQEQFADGITEDIITDLSGLSNLLVIASNTSFSYKGRRVAAQQVGADLHVGFVLEGSIRRHGNDIRVNAQLVDAGTGFQKWAQRYDRRVDEVFVVQDELTGSIVDALAITITDKEKQRLTQRNTNSLQAYDYFREGQRLSKGSSKDTNIQAQEAYRGAIDADPEYGRAYGALAYTMAYNYRRGWSDSPVQIIDQALELAKKAVTLDSSIPQTYWSLGYVHLMRKEYEKADEAVSMALSIAPNYADGYGLLALIKNALGDPQEAIALIEKGITLNPYYTWDYPYNLGRAYYTLGRYDEAIEILEEARRRNENAVPVRLHLAASYAAAGRQDDAEWEVQEIQVLSPTDTVSHLWAAHPIKDSVLMNNFVNDLRMAGLPE